MADYLIIRTAILSVGIKKVIVGIGILYIKNCVSIQKIGNKAMPVVVISEPNFLCKIVIQSEGEEIKKAKHQ